MNERNEIENDVENEMSQKTEETDVGINVLPEDAPASSEVPDSSPADHEVNQDQSSGNGEEQKDDCKQKKNTQNKKKENKKKKNKK